MFFLGGQNRQIKIYKPIQDYRCVFFVEFGPHPRQFKMNGLRWIKEGRVTFPIIYLFKSKRKQFTV